MARKLSLVIAFAIGLIINQSMKGQQKMKEEFKPISFEQADEKADSVLKLMTLEEKISYVVGDKDFFIRAIPRLNLHEVYMSDATQGVHLRSNYHEYNLSKYQLR